MSWFFEYFENGIMGLEDKDSTEVIVCLGIDGKTFWFFAYLYDYIYIYK